MPQHHLTAPRGAESAPRSHFVQGRFGRMFRNLPSFEPDDQVLADLAKEMFEEKDPGGAGGEEDEGLDGPIPAGFTYLGQFIDHDITFDPVSTLQRLNDPDGLHDFRTPRFDLDSVYGDGPNNNPFIYDSRVDDGRTSFLIGENGARELDLPRNRLPDADGLPQGRALIGDPRNDENVIVGQLHLLFLLFHNRVVDFVRAKEPTMDSQHLFDEAQRLVRWHYQWIVAHDFLSRIVGQDVLDDILFDDELRAASGSTKTKIKRIHLQFYHWEREPFMPVEFSVAAYRFGHSMIRPDYLLNPRTPEIPIFTSGALTDEHQDLRGFRPLASQWTIDWSFFFETGDAANLQHARNIDSKLAEPLTDVPNTNVPHVLAERNLRRGKILGLPSGQRVARAMCIDPLSDEALDLIRISPVFTESAPLWFYILKEAEVAGTSTLGQVGGRIVAEVLLGLMKGDPFSYIRVEPCWRPGFEEEMEDFTMSDLIEFALGTGATAPPSPYEARR